MLRWSLFFLWCAGTFCYDMAKLRTGSPNPSSRTSSTLAWKMMKAGDPLPIDAVPIDAKHPSSFWCKVRLNSVWVPGSFKEGDKCIVAFLKSKVTKESNFEVLLSINNSSRIVLKEWDSLTPKPESSILSGSSYSDRVLAVVSSKDDPDVLVAASTGFKDVDRNAITHFDDDVQHINQAYVLVEDEPIEYVLKDINFLKYSNTAKFPVVLQSTQLINEGSESALLKDVVPYEVIEKQYYGRPKGVISGLPTLVYPQKGKEFELELGMGTEVEFIREDFALVEYHLPPNSGVNITLMGTRLKFEVPFSGMLDAIYNDDHVHSYVVSAYHINEILITVIAKYGTPFFLNGTSTEIEEQSKLVYESTTTTTTTSTTSTSTTTSTTTTTTTTTTTPLPTTTELIEDITASDTAFLHNSEETVLHPESLEKIEEKSLEKEDNQQSSKRDESSGTSDKFISGVAALFTALVFWYFGAPV